MKYPQPVLLILVPPSLKPATVWPIKETVPMAELVLELANVDLLFNLDMLAIPIHFVVIPIRKHMFREKIKLKCLNLMKLVKEFL